MTPFRPQFIASRGSRLFTIYFPPAGPASRGALLYLPPFAEEMNRSRRMISLAARRYAAAGHAVGLLDPTGCGDSDGDFGSATWEDWLDDAADAVAWLAAESGCGVTLWGLRTGGALAACLAARQSVTVAGLVLWSPVVSGSAFLTQFLRLRLAAVMAAGGSPETTASLREALLGGETLEIAGYGLSPGMAAGLDRVDLAHQPPPADCPVEWIEVQPGPDRPVPPAARRVASAWQEAGVRLTQRVVAGDQFWQTAEITLAPALLEACRAVPGAAP